MATPCRTFVFANATKVSMGVLMLVATHQRTILSSSSDKAFKMSWLMFVFLANSNRSCSDSFPTLVAVIFILSTIPASILLQKTTTLFGLFCLVCLHGINYEVR